jgi:hypothetical protein
MASNRFGGWPLSSLVSVGALVGLLTLASPDLAWPQAQLGSPFLLVPTPTTSAGFIYRFDPTTGGFVREREVAGQIYVERPAPLGQGKWNLALSYQWFHFTGDDELSSDVHVHELTAGVTYGVTDDLDINLTVPVLYLTPHGALSVDPVFVRAKYRLLDRPELQLAGGVVVRTLTLSLLESDTVGRVQPGLFLYASRERLALGHAMYLQPYVNLGVAADDSGTQTLEVRWAAGVDWSVTDRVTTAFGFLANHRPNAPRESDSPDSVYHFSGGARVNLWRETLVGFVNVLVPVNFSGLDPVPLVGLEATI